MSSAALIHYLEQEATQAVPAEVTQLYASFCATLLRPNGVVAGLFYGSALWKTPEPDTVWDLYILVEAYRDVTARRGLILAGTLLPPNVYYHEARQADGTVLRSKIAVMTLEQFTRHCAGRVLAPQTWARFAQSTRIIHARNAGARDAIVAALAQAVITFHRATAPWVRAPLSIEQFWQLGLTQTYASEFRAERGNRQQHRVEASRAAFMMRSNLACMDAGAPRITLNDGLLTATLSARHAQRLRGLQRLRNGASKLQHLMRLIKAAFTFVGGLDYLVYKIERHSGVKLTPSAFARAYPLLGVWPLFVKGLRARAFR
jgi:hypothetical protein